jgi:hypothetical protein
MLHILPFAMWRILGLFDTRHNRPPQGVANGGGQNNSHPDELNYLLCLTMSATCTDITRRIRSHGAMLQRTVNKSIGQWNGLRSYDWRRQYHFGNLWVGRTIVFVDFLQECTETRGNTIFRRSALVGETRCQRDSRRHSDFDTSAHQAPDSVRASRGLNDVKLGT